MCAKFNVGWLTTVFERTYLFITLTNAIRALRTLRRGTAFKLIGTNATVRDEVRVALLYMLHNVTSAGRCRALSEILPRFHISQEFCVSYLSIVFCQLATRATLRTCRNTDMVATLFLYESRGC